MTKLDKQAIIEMLVYILNKTGGLTKYHLLKTLYFAHRAYMVKEGLPLIADQIVAMEYGPVPSETYDWVKNTDAELLQAIELIHPDGTIILRAGRKANLDYIAIAEREILDYAIDEYAHLSFGALYDLSHDKVWHKYYPGHRSSAPIPNMAIAEGAGASPEILESLATYLSLCN